MPEGIAGKKNCWGDVDASGGSLLSLAFVGQRTPADGSGAWVENWHTKQASLVEFQFRPPLSLSFRLDGSGVQVMPCATRRRESWGRRQASD